LARGRFRSLSVSETVYNKLREIAERRGFSTLADTIAYLVSLEELIVRRLESVTSNTGNVTTSSGNVTSNTGNVTSTGGGYEWCRSRSSIKNLEGYLEYLKRSLDLEDWWEEDGRVCVRTRRRPAKT